MSQPPGNRKEIILKYQQNIQDHASAILQLKKEKKWIALARLISVLAGFGIGWYYWPATVPVISTVGFCTISLTYFIFLDTNKSLSIKNRERLIFVNRHETDAMQHRLAVYDNGSFFSDSAHAYAADLDLFGESSLFQWMNRCHADQSKELLAFYLKNPETPQLIQEKQKAAKELAGKQENCQQFQSTAMANPLTYKTEKKLLNWISYPVIGYKNPLWKWFQYVYPVFPVSVFTLYMLDWISMNTILLCLVGFYVLHFLISRKILSEFAHLLNIEPEMETMSKQLDWIEKENFQSRQLQSLQNRLKPSGYTSASASIRDFNSILKKINWRANLLINAVLQLFFIWDLRLILLMNAWKKKNQHHLPLWIKTIAEMEVTISLASLVYNEPDWCFPEVDEKYFHFSATEIGHPLIPMESRVNNDFSLEGSGRIALITGSNMAGKSTFLRSLGINTVLALMGSPVCAQRMNLSLLKLVSSMRVADNLAENTSTFYAELKKLEYIIVSVNRNEPVFILLDEVLRGTNSTDRHKGTRALVRQLIRHNAVAVMATHDTELAHSESADNTVSNYHFEGKILGNELYFDYRIKRGICESLNATTLMKKIGIQFED
jgi:DNA mismatch repair ATPase MutS